MLFSVTTIVKDHREQSLFSVQTKPALKKGQRVFSDFLLDLLTTEIFILSREHDFVLLTDHQILSTFFA